LTGIAASLRNRPALLAVLIWLAVMIVRALPQAPGHDGVRQIAVAFGMTAILAAWGLVVCARRCGSSIAGTCAALAVVASVVSCIRYHPLQLSYYSEAVGGLPGAAKHFEPTYFWDALTPDVVDWLNANTDRDRTAFFQTNPENWRYLHRWGRLTARPHSPETAGAFRPQWYVMQHRTGSLHPHDKILIDRHTPAFRKSLFGVPLVSVYRFDDYERSR
jgi:hypothetical protein